MKNKIKTIYRLTTITILFFFIFITPLVAGAGEILFVETDVDLQADGSAVVAYTVQWRVLSAVDAEGNKLILFNW